MKMVEQYLVAVGRQLPWKGRREIKQELRSLLMDEIEGRYGQNPSEEEIREALLSFGSPGTIAARYRDEQCVIAPGLTSFYFFLLKIVLGSIALAFFVLLLLNLVRTGAADGWAREIIGFIGNTLNAWMGGFVFITVGFMAVTRLGWVQTVDLEDDWTPDELADEVVGLEPVSRLESILYSVLLLVMLGLMNFHPGIVSAAEDLFLRSGLGIGHRINVSVFRVYMHVMSVIWLAELVFHGMMLAGVPRTGRLRALEAGAELGSLVVLAALVFDGRVYTGYTGIAGFQLVFILLFLIGLWELVGIAIREFKLKQA